MKRQISASQLVNELERYPNIPSSYELQTKQVLAYI